MVMMGVGQVCNVWIDLDRFRLVWLGLYEFDQALNQGLIACEYCSNSATKASDDMVKLCILVFQHHIILRPRAQSVYEKMPGKKHLLQTYLLIILTMSVMILLITMSILYSNQQKTTAEVRILRIEVSRCNTDASNIREA